MVFISRARARLYWAAFTANLLYISTGCAQTWSSPTLSRLPQHLASNASLIATIFLLGSVLGPFGVSVLTTSIGRKGTLLAVGALYLLSWLLIGSSYNLALILTGRIIGGIAVGSSFVAVPIYLSEISEEQLKEVVGSMTEFFIGVGYLLEYVLGPMVTYTTLAAISAAPAILFCLLLIPLPDTPFYLLEKNKLSEASRALAWFRASPEDSVQHELQAIQAAIQSSKEYSGKKLDLFKKNGALPHFKICIIFFLVSTFSIISIITTFTETIFDNSGLPISTKVGTTVFGVANLVSTGLAPPLVSSYGLKAIYISSNCIVSASLALLGVFFFLSDYGVDMGFWVRLCPIPLLMIYNMAFCIGCGPLTWSAMALVLPTSVKKFGLGLVSTLMWMGAFLITELYSLWPFSSAYPFLFFGIALGILTIILHYRMPSLKGRSLQEIHELIAGRLPLKIPEKEASG